MYIARRLFGALVTLVAVSITTFGLFFAIPADPAALQCGRECTPEQVEQIHQNLGLDRPIYQQYGEFMSGIVTGRRIGSGEGATECPAPCLGYSYRTFEPVTEMMARAVPITISIAAGAGVLWLCVGVAVGVLAALRRGTWIDKAAIGLTLGGASAQTFFVGLMLQVVLVYGLGWLPLPSYTSPFEDPWRWFTGMLLPWVTLATVFAAAYARLTRSQMIEALSEEFVLTARAKGTPAHSVVRQAMRAAITPVVTIAGLDIGSLLGGAVITETVFALPGIGAISVQASQELNLPVVMATVLVAAFFVVVMNLVVDLLYAVIDPRVRLS
jgi:peptide/nickel transport system permease protein